MKIYSVRLGLVEDAMLKEVLKKSPTHQEVTRFLERMIRQEYNKKT